MPVKKGNGGIDLNGGYSYSSVSEFTEFLETQATRMELNGFMAEATNLRQWAAELNRKAAEKLQESSEQ